MRPVVTAAEMRALDRATIDDIGIPAFTLMETAGRAVATSPPRCSASRRRRPRRGRVRAGQQRRRWVRRGARAARCAASTRSSTSPRRARRSRAMRLAHLAILERAGGVVLRSTRRRRSASSATHRRAALVIDALFGVGLARPIEGHLAEVVAAINARRARARGRHPVGPRRRHRARARHVRRRRRDRHDGRAQGRARAARRGSRTAARSRSPTSAIPSGVLATQAVRARARRGSRRRRAGCRSADAARSQGPARPRRRHRRHAGDARGRAARRARGAARAAPASSRSRRPATSPPTTRSMTQRARDGNLGALLDGKAAVVIGPGLGQSELAAGWVGEVLASGVPGGARCRRAEPRRGHRRERSRRRAGPVVITPHPGEAARLLGIVDRRGRGRSARGGARARGEDPRGRRAQGRADDRLRRHARRRLLLDQPDRRSRARDRRQRRRARRA